MNLHKRIALTMLMVTISSMILPSFDPFKNDDFFKKSFENDFNASRNRTRDFSHNDFNADRNNVQNDFNRLQNLSLGLIVAAVVIATPIYFIPSFVGWNACGKRADLQERVVAFKATLNKEQLAKFNEIFQPYDTWAVSKAPFCTQLAFIAPVPFPNVVRSFGWTIAAGLAGGAQYCEYYNEEQFNKAVEAVNAMDVTSSSDNN